jgi:hypothetical protein
MLTDDPSFPFSTRSEPIGNPGLSQIGADGPLTRPSCCISASPFHQVGASRYPFATGYEIRRLASQREALSKPVVTCRLQRTSDDGQPEVWSIDSDVHKAVFTRSRLPWSMIRSADLMIPALRLPVVTLTLCLYDQGTGEVPSS